MTSQNRRGSSRGKSTEPKRKDSTAKEETELCAGIVAVWMALQTAVARLPPHAAKPMLRVAHVAYELAAVRNAADFVAGQAGEDLVKKEPDRTRRLEAMTKSLFEVLVRHREDLRKELVELGIAEWAPFETMLTSLDLMEEPLQSMASCESGRT